MPTPWILTDEARAPLAFATDAPQDAFAVSAALAKRFGLTAEQRAEVLTQVELRARAARRWGRNVDDLWFTRDGLEQATRPVLAAWRAERLRGLGVAAVADLGCGLGFESRALAQAGMHVVAVELDARTAAFAAANLRDVTAEVRVGDVTDPAVLEAALAATDAVFLDPARRDTHAPRSIDGLSGQRVADPEDWSPPWSWVRALADRQPRLVAKVAPGIDHALIPTGADAVWAQVDGDLVEASVWFPGLATGGVRTALAIGDGVARLDSRGAVDEAVTPIGAHLLDVAPVVTRSGLVTTLAAALGATRIDPHVGYLTCDTVPAPSPFVTAYRVLEVLPFDRRAVGKRLRALHPRELTVMKRAFAADTEALRRDWLKAAGTRSDGPRLAVALTRIGRAPVAVICTV